VKVAQTRGWRDGGVRGMIKGGHSPYVLRFSIDINSRVLSSDNLSVCFDKCSTISNLGKVAGCRLECDK
jgi:hypothetical protein